MRKAVVVASMLAGCSVAPLTDVHDAGALRSKDGSAISIRDSGVDAGTGNARDGGMSETRDSGPVRDGGPRDSGIQDPMPRDGGMLTTFLYPPSNFVPVFDGGTGFVVPDNTTCTFDTTSLDFQGDGCPDAVPFVREEPPDSPMVTIIEVAGLLIEGTFNVTGGRPLIIGVHGNADISGLVWAGAVGSGPGAGADDTACGQGTDGQILPGAPGGGGGGAGGYGSRGGSGGDGLNGSTNGGNRGASNGNNAIVPLRGGCGGGAGVGPMSGRSIGGGGGGAIQISAAGRVTIVGTIAAPGGGGQTGPRGTGGGGGGSGGAVLLEGQALDFGPQAVVVASGGGGAGGNAGGASALPGDDGASVFDIAEGGAGGGVVAEGGGGDAAFESTPARGGETSGFGGGGGGGGGEGRIRLNAVQCSGLADVEFFPTPTGC